MKNEKNINDYVEEEATGEVYEMPPWAIHLAFISQVIKLPAFFVPVLGSLILLGYGAYLGKISVPKFLAKKFGKYHN